ncbi:MAG TPA: shikimate dehydrogenase [Rhizobiaceae bacterium]|nr:shikimate dehydrogenase [Rhizobiaceae bacterium]
MADLLRRAFVCGHPVAHSRSPLIHGFWLERYGIAGSYEKLDIHPDDITRFITELPQSPYAGGNVTIPHKEAAFAAVARRDDAAGIIGAVNTLWVEDGRVIGGNTDAYGYGASLDAAVPAWRSTSSATVLGAGGAARAVVFALAQAGLSDIRIVNRTRARARELADRFGGGASAHGWDAVPELLADTGLLVNTTPLGMNGASTSDVDVAFLPDSAIVSDIVYVPLETPLLAAARQRGLVTVDGLGMLLHQAVAGFAKWFDVVPDVSVELRARIVADLEGAH